MSHAPREDPGAEGILETQTENKETRPKMRRKEARYSQGRDEREGTSSHNPDSPHLLGQKTASAERKKCESDFSVKADRGEEVKG